MSHTKAKETDLKNDLSLLAPWLQERFPKASALRFSVFVPKDWILEKQEVPAALDNLFGTLREMGRTLWSIGTCNDNEWEFAGNLANHEEEGLGYRPIQIRNQCLQIGTLLPIRPREIEMPVLMGTRPINIARRKVRVDSGAWVPARPFAWA